MQTVLGGEVGLGPDPAGSAQRLGLVVTGRAVRAWAAAPHTPGGAALTACRRRRVSPDIHGDAVIQRRHCQRDAVPGLDQPVRRRLPVRPQRVTAKSTGSTASAPCTIVTTKLCPQVRATVAGEVASVTRWTDRDIGGTGRVPG
jgi:hypothetical protein